MGRCGWGRREEGRGRDVGAAGTAEYVCAANLTRTFEKAKSQREHRRCRRGSAALQTAGTKTGAGLFCYYDLFYFFLTGARRTNNYHNNPPPRTPHPTNDGARGGKKYLPRKEVGGKKRKKKHNCRSISKAKVFRSGVNDAVASAVHISETRV